MTDKDKKTFTSSFDRLPNKEAEKHFNQKSLITSAEFANFKAYQHALAFTVAGIADKDMLTEIHKAVKSAIDNGTSFNEFKKSLKPFLVSKGWLAPELTGDKKTDKELLKDYETYVNRRLKTIYHTNKSTAYAAGRWERIQKTKDFLPFLQYLPSASVNKRDGHKAYYGIIRPVDDPIWRSIYPPNGFGCKCSVKQITKSKAEQLGISDDERIAELPTPDFDSNFDRLGSLLRLAEDKHGAEFVKKLGVELRGEMVSYAVKAGIARQKLSHILPNSQNALNLAKDPNGKSRLAEGVLADQWEQFHKVKLERYDGNRHKVLVQNDPADYAIVDLAQEPTAWVTLDFMFTLEPDANKAEFNRSFYKSDKAWEKRQNRILQHLAKADFVPMYLRHLDSKALVKIIGFVLSLPKDLQEKIILIE